MMKHFFLTGALWFLLPCLAFGQDENTEDASNMGDPTMMGDSNMMGDTNMMEDTNMMGGTSMMQERSSPEDTSMMQERSSPEDAADEAFNMQLGMSAMALLGKCNIDMMSLMNTANGVNGGNFEPTNENPLGLDEKTMRTLVDVAKQMAVFCTEKEAKAFTTAMTEFETCAGFDLLEVTETLLDSLFGMEIECLLSMAGDWTGEMPSPGDPITLSNQCVDALLGTNPFGDALRSTFLNPDRVLPCFSKLSTAIPACVVEQWPVPVIGSMLKPLSCLIGGSGDILDLFFQIEVGKLNECIPESIDACDAVQQGCVMDEALLMMLPPPLLGAPLPDGLERYANDNDMSSVVTRYNAFVDRCASVWDGWTAVHVQTASEAAPSVEEEDNPEEDSAQDADAIVIEEKGEGAASSSPVKLFFSGLFTGMAVSGIACFIFMRSQQQNFPKQQPRYKSVSVNDQESEMEETEMEETEMTQA